jgi:tRNA 2-thiouridine synthesizing protein A
MSDKSTTNSDEPIILDLKGLTCPLPALRTRKALNAMASGATLLVECTDPLSAIDVPHCVFECGDALEDRSSDGGVLRFLIRRQARGGGI